MTAAAPAAHRLITTAAELVDVAAALATAPWVALDTESNSMFVYREQVCLLQLNAGGVIFVIDPLALGVVANATPSSALAVLKPGLERRDRPLWLHGGEYDVACMKRDFGIALGGVFDTQQAASLLGWAKTGYGSVVEKLCGVVLGKAWATYDWATRPLDPGALAYAVDDVVYLPEVAVELKKLVAQADIVDEVDVANAVVAAYDWTGGFDPEGFWRMRDTEHLSPSSVRVLKRLFAWRDAAAEAAGVPAGRYLNNEVVLALARHPPTTMGDLKDARLKSAIIADHGRTILQHVVDSAADPVPSPPTSTRPSSAVMARETRLKTWRREEAERRSVADGRTVPLQLVLPARALEFLKSREPDVDLSTVPQLGARRAARYGGVLRALLAP